MENLIKGIMAQFPVGAKLEISESHQHEHNLILAIRKGNFAITSIIPDSVSNTEFFGLVTDSILEFNRKAPLK